jgi:DNA-binding NarL/FixJ family response regulator
LLKAINTMALLLKNDRLTKRQAEVARCLAQSFTKSQIAEKLFIEYQTVTEHCRTLTRKWGMQVARTAALQAEAKRRGYSEEQE